MLQPRPIDLFLSRWHEVYRSPDPNKLRAVLREDCVLWSPVLHTPQQGRENVTRYLTAAGGALLSKGDRTGESSKARVPGEWDGRFRYIKEIGEGNHCVLEFETMMAGKYVNGIDMITCDDDGNVAEFKVMLRPLQAVNAMRELMATILEHLPSADS